MVEIHNNLQHLHICKDWLSEKLKEKENQALQENPLLSL